MERNTEAVLKAARLGDVPMLTQLHNEVKRDRIKMSNFGDLVEHAEYADLRLDVRYVHYRASPYLP